MLRLYPVRRRSTQKRLRQPLVELSLLGRGCASRSPGRHKGENLVVDAIEAGPHLAVSETFPVQAFTEHPECLVSFMQKSVLPSRLSGNLNQPVHLGSGHCHGDAQLVQDGGDGASCIFRERPAHRFGWILRRRRNFHLRWQMRRGEDKKPLAFRTASFHAARQFCRLEASLAVGAREALSGRHIARSLVS
jgi:hypothetical protein